MSAAELAERRAAIQAAIELTAAGAYEPVDDRILILPQEAPDKSKGGILLPDKVKEVPSRGKVVRVGPGLPVTTLPPTRRDPEGDTVVWDFPRAALPFKPGQDVIYSRWSGTDVEIAGVTFKVIRPADVMLIDRTADLVPLGRAGD